MEKETYEDSEQEESEPVSDVDDEKTEIRKELSNMSFEDLMKLKDELGTKTYNEAVFGAENPKHKKVANFKRLNKNRPREMSSRRPVPFLSNDNKKKLEASEIRDPRFDEKCGEYNSKIFRNNYNFIEDVRTNEIKELKAKLKKTEDSSDKSHLKYLIQRLENQNRELRKQKNKEIELNQEKEEIQKAKAEGKPVFYKTKKEQKARQLLKQYLELKKEGKLDKHLEKRRKKNAARDRKKLKIN